METVGFIFGLSGLSFAIIAWGQISSLRKEFEDLKRTLEDSSVLKEQPKPADEWIINCQTHCCNHNAMLGIFSSICLIWWMS